MSERFTHKVITEKKPDGGVKHRDIYVPSAEAYQDGRQLATFINQHPAEFYSPHATGSIPGKSVMDNAYPHRNNNHFVMYDLQDAYSNTDLDQLIDTICSNGLPLFNYAPDPLQAVTDEVYKNSLIDEDGVFQGLPAGGPASPALFNISCLPLDQQLSGYCQQEDITYTRYLDDITFSSRNPIGKARRRKLRAMIEGHPGAIVNDKKTKIHTLENGPVTITGISLYPNRRLQPNPQFVKIVKEFFTVAALAYKTNDQELINSLYPDEQEFEGQLNGYNGAIRMMGYKTTAIARQLEKLYQEANKSYWGDLR